METLAAVLLGFFAVGYFVLGGADIGVGMLLPYLGRDGRERRLVVATVAPFFLAHEVWLVATAGLLVGAFPGLEAELFGGLFPLIVVVVTGWVVRDMGLWSRGRAGNRVWPAICDGAVTLGSWAVAAGWGWIMAGLLSGVTDAVATGAAAAMLAAAVVVMFALHGLAFASLRLTEPLRSRARPMAGPAGDRATFALTGTAMTALVLAAGVRLAPTASAADGTTLALLVPAVCALLPLLLIGQVVTWRVFGRRVTGPSYL
ncbi:cytochrome d ubiquinol oxidase subunit II [Jiangella gansuensis]|uniref:cytochrome d ubiquinol oxidase subunit II n=1 Tax=Jiangella gansuensis TaxID=281473 RepID=UPI00047E5B71|nr:cytochrome d ubiquinol oxidase subunit II [Jiangella gansuensis]